MNFTFLLISLSFGLLTSFLSMSLLCSLPIHEYLIILLSSIPFGSIPSFYRIRTAFSSSVPTISGTIISIPPSSIMISSTFLSPSIIIFPSLIKIPSLPFFYRLPEVHCESNPSISLPLAGPLPKSSIYGILRFISSSFFLSLRSLSSSVLSFTPIGIIIACRSCFRYFDLKKIIAFPPISHPNPSLISLFDTDQNH